PRDWSADVCSSDLAGLLGVPERLRLGGPGLVALLLRLLGGPACGLLALAGSAGGAPGGCWALSSWSPPRGAGAVRVVCGESTRRPRAVHVFAGRAPPLPCPASAPAGPPPRRRGRSALPGRHSPRPRASPL